jgi:hypothetical protein
MTSMLELLGITPEMLQQAWARPLQQIPNAQGVPGGGPDWGQAEILPNVHTGPGTSPFDGRQLLPDIHTGNQAAGNPQNDQLSGSAPTAQPAPSGGSWWSQPGNTELLLGLGSGLLEASRPGGGGLAAGFGRGALQGMALRNQAVGQRAQEHRAAIYDQQVQAQIEQQKREQEQKDQERAQLEGMIGALPPDQQKLARFDPHGYAAAMLKQQMPDTAKPSSEMAQIASDVANGFLTREQGAAEMRKLTYIAPNEGPETWSAPETINGVQYQRSSRGQLHPLGGGAGGEPLVEVYDPTSPTGTTLKRRSEAENASGKPPSGFTVTTDKDGHTTVTMGRQGQATGEKPLPADQVGKAASVTGGLEDAKAARAFVMPIDPVTGKESPNRVHIGELRNPIPFTGGPVPFTAGTGAAAQIGNAVDAIMRLRTGAGMPNAEKQDYIDRYTPKVTDPAETVKIKSDMLERDLKLAQELFDASRNKPPAGDGAALPTLSPEQAAQLPPGTKFKTTDGRVVTRK